MNVVFSIRFFLASMSTVSLIVIPRLLYYFGLRAEALDILMSPWATFLIILFVGGLLVFPWLKNIKLAVFAVLAIICAAMILTFYFCELSLPW